MFQFSFQLDDNRVLSNNQAKYEALIIGLEIAKELNIKHLSVSRDSQRVIRLITGQYKCYHPLLAVQLNKVKALLQDFDDVQFQHVLRIQNDEANQMAQIASGVKIPEGNNERVIRVQKRFLPFSIERDEYKLEAMTIDISNDWRIPINRYLTNPNEKVDRTIRCRAINYVVLGNNLYRKTSDGLLLLCIDKAQSMTVKSMKGLVDPIMQGEKLRWLIKRYGYFWPSIRKDCIQYVRGCQKCQKHGPIQRAPIHLLQLIVKPWPFRGWAIDMIDEIHPASSLQHAYVIVATDYFTKWTKAIPMKGVAQK
ncbi:hypothetical protein RHGRI_031467 [Rhododendron griersonianum]|uniref:Uncharacterized protein n=1 Tax=Rhododendron griersonianum TaxID=479676 RepID=A0AAV6IAK5_9ERIC|nr:hypothetical protein RHGRI_031467 [Rhododendron griersonianum]